MVPLFTSITPNKPSSLPNPRFGYGFSDISSLLKKATVSIVPAEDTLDLSTTTLPVSQGSTAQIKETKKTIEFLPLLTQLNNQAHSMEWTRWSSNLEGSLKVGPETYSIRLARGRTIPEHPTFSLQVFKKNPFLSFSLASSLLFNVDNIEFEATPTSSPSSTASLLNDIHTKAIKSMPQLPGGEPIYQLGNSHYALSYVQPENRKDHPGGSDWLFRVRKAESSQTNALKESTNTMGYVDAQGFHLLAEETQSQTDWHTALANEAISIEDIVNKGTQLFQPAQKTWSFF